MTGTGIKWSYHCNSELNLLAQRITTWREGRGFETGWMNVPEKLMLVVTELSEAMEAYRKLPMRLCQLMDESDKREWHKAAPKTLWEYAHLLEEHKEPLGNFREELADMLIRLLDLTASLGVDIEEEIDKKMRTNAARPHKHNKER